MKTLTRTILACSIALVFHSLAAAQAPNIGVNGYFANDKAAKGRVVQAAIVIDIPSGYHINSNRPLENFLIATSLKVEGPRDVRLGPVAYPRAALRKFSFSQKQLSVYENKVILRFNVAVPANYSGGSVNLKGHLRLQSCNDDVCFQPRNFDQNMSIDVVGANERVKRVNGWVFGGR